MRHLPRLRGAVSASLCCSSPTHIRTTAVAAVATTSSSTKTQSLQRRNLSTSLPRCDAVEAYAPPQGLKPPPQGWKTAVRPDKITDPAYEPAQDGLGLEEVGGLDGWWENPANYGTGRQWVGYGPAEKVIDPAVLEVAVYRALVEAMIARGGVKTLTARMFAVSDSLLGSEWGPETLTTTTVQTKLCVGSNGALEFKSTPPEPQLEQKVTEEVDTAATAKQEAEPTEGANETEVLEEAREEVEVKEAVEVQEEGLTEGPISSETAQALLKEIGHEWKKATIKDYVFKYFVAKRIQKLTGHIIPDGKLVAINTAGTLLREVVRPPKAKKLVEEIENKQLFQSLPNVRVFPRRVTPIDKEKMVGRWKVIREELERRGLPVIGTANIDNAIEKKWVTGAK